MDIFNRKSLVIFFSAATFLVGCFGAGTMHLRKAKRLRAEGNLIEARVEMRRAIKKEPTKVEYKSALDDLESEIEERVADKVADAKAKQRKGQWNAAAELYTEASKLKPYDIDFKAHAALSSIKSKALDNLNWYRELLKVSKDLLKSKVLQSTLQKAKTKAYQEQLGAARVALDNSDGPKAHKAFETAKSIDKAMPGANPESVAKAEALFLAAQAKALFDENKPVQAYQTYKKAYEKQALPVIRSAMKAAQRKASRIIRVLDQAAAAAERSQFEKATQLYDLALKMEGVPASVKSERTEAANSFIAQALSNSGKEIESGRLSRAASILSNAVKYYESDPANKDLLNSALKSIRKREPGEAVRFLEQSSLAPSDKLRVSVEKLAFETAKNVLSAAKRLSKGRASQALAMLSGLTIFAEELPEIRDIRRDLFKLSFSSMLSEAKRQAKRGNDSEAANILREAVEATSDKAPEGMLKPARKGCDELAKKRFIQAEQEFDAALVVAPRSKLAQAAIEIARSRRKAAEQSALQAVKTGRGDVASAVDVLEGIRIAAPGTRTVRSAAEALLAKLKRLTTSSDDKLVSEFITYLSRLEEISTNARDKLVEGAKQISSGQYDAAERSFQRAEDASVESGTAPVARALANKKQVASLEKKYREAKELTSERANALAALLEVQPQYAAAEVEMNKIFELAKKAAKKGEDEAVSRYLGLATTISRPSSIVRAKLSKAHETLAAGKTNEAEKLYRSVLKTNVEQPVARVGREIARGNRNAVLLSAVDTALKGSGYEQLKAALKRSWDADREDEDLNDAIDELLNSAKSQATKGEIGRAADLLSCVNAITANAELAQTIESTIALLRSGKNVEAKQAFTGIKSRSAVAQAGLAIARGNDAKRLMAGVKKLALGKDAKANAALAAELLSQEPTNSAVLDAIKKTMIRAQKAAKAVNIEKTLLEMTAANIAGGGDIEIEKALAIFAEKKFLDAAKVFEKGSSELAKLGVEISRSFRTQALRAGIGQDDATTAESIRALLAENPLDKQALRSLAKMLRKAEKLLKQQKLDKAAAVYTAATMATGAPESQAAKTREALTLLTESKVAQAEKILASQLNETKDSQVLKSAVKSVRSQRLKQEKAFLQKLNRGTELIDSAKGLAMSLLIDSNNRSVKAGLLAIRRQISSAISKRKPVTLSNLIVSQAYLKQASSDQIAAVEKAAKALTANELPKAESEFTKLVPEGEGSAQTIPAVAAKHIRALRIQEAKQQLASLERSRNILKASKAAIALFDLDPTSRQAKRTVDKYKTKVTQQRLKASAAQTKLGKLGT
ncbi:MAG: hypothetical protein VYC39_12090, partial [Myxococcota bacterium]|nr:hypothetical protein [Myxococcota bacterium]